MPQDLGPFSLLTKSRWSFFHSPGTCRCERNSLHRGLQKVQSQGRENMREKPIYVSIAPMLAVCTNPELSVGKHNQDCNNFTELEFFWKVIGWPRFVTQEHFPEFQ